MGPVTRIAARTLPDPSRIGAEAALESGPCILGAVHVQFIFSKPFGGCNLRGRNKMK